jgi:chromosome segregation ATPase
MLATVVLLLALQSSPQTSEAQQIRNQLEQTREQIVVLEQKLYNLQSSKEKHQKIPAGQLDQLRTQIEKSKQELAYFEALLHQHLAARDDIDELEKELDRLFPLKALPIPPEHPPGPRLKSST